MKLCYLFLIWAISLASLSQAKAEGMQEIAIGATLPLTGSLSHVGVDIQRGMELAAEDAKRDGISIKFFYEDNQHQALRAASAARKLLDVNQVDVLISLWDMADVVAPLADTKKVPHLSIRWNPHIAERYKYTATLESTYKTYVKSQIELLKALGAQKLSLVTEESQGWRLSADELKRTTQENGMIVVSDQTFNSQESDFKTIILKLLHKNPDIVVINAHQPHLDVIIKRIRETNPKQQITGYFEAVEPPSLVEGLPFVAQFKVAPWFSEKFLNRFHEPFKVRAPHGYDLVKIISTIYMKAQKKISADDFIHRLEELKNYQGASGLLSVNTTKNIENTCVWQVVDGGSFLDLTSEKINQLKETKHK